MPDAPFRILILSTFFPPINSIASLRPYSWAKTWSQAGHDVTVATPKIVNGTAPLHFPVDSFCRRIEIPICWPFQKIREKTSSNSPHKPNLIEKIRQRTGIFSACRLPDLTDFFIRPAVKTLFSLAPWDLIVSTSGPPAPHKVAQKLVKRLPGTPWIADFRDYWVDHPFYPGCFPITFFEKRIERAIARKADFLTVVSPSMQLHMEKKYPGTSVYLVENGYDPDDLAALNPTPIFPSDGKKRIVYTGTIQPGVRDPSPLFGAMHSLRREKGKTALDNLEVIFAGSGTERLQPLVERYSLENYVLLKGVVPRPDALRMQRDANLQLLIEQKGTKTDHLLPGKLIEYLAAKRPILALGVSEKSDAGKMIQKFDTGYLTATDKDKVKNVLKALLDGKVSKQTQLRSSLARYTRQALAEKILQLAQGQVQPLVDRRGV